MNSIEIQDKTKPESDQNIIQQPVTSPGMKPIKQKENSKKKIKNEFIDDERKLYLFSLLNEYRDRSQIDKIEKELSKGISPNIQNSEGKSLLMIASELGSLDLVQLLLNKNADVKLRDNKGRSAIHYAIESRSENLDLVISLLENGASPISESYDKSTVLHRAIDKGYISIARELLQREATVNATTESSGDTPLHLAVKNANHNAIRLLMEYNCGIHIKNRQKKTPLDYADENLTQFIQQLEMKQKESQADVIKKVIDTPLRQREKVHNEDNFPEVLKHIDKEANKRVSQNHDEDPPKDENPKKLPKHDRAEHNQDQNTQKSQNRKRKSENGTPVTNPRQSIDTINKSITNTVETTENGQLVQSPTKQKGQKFNNQQQQPLPQQIQQIQQIQQNQPNQHLQQHQIQFINPNQQQQQIISHIQNQSPQQMPQNQMFNFNPNPFQNMPFNQPFPGPNGFHQSNPGMLTQQNFNQNSQGKKKKNNLNFNQQPQNQFPNSNYVYDSRSNPQTPTQKPTNSFNNSMQLSRQNSDGYQNQQKYNNQGQNQKGTKGQGKMKNHQMMMQNPNFNGMIDMSQQTLKMMNQMPINDDSQKQNMNMQYMRQTPFNLQQNNIVQNSLIFNFHTPNYGPINQHHNLMFQNFQGNLINQTPDPNYFEKPVYNMNFDDPKFLANLNHANAETLNQKNKDLLTQIEEKTAEINDLNVWFVATKENVNKLKETLKEKDNKIQDLTRKNQELENKLRGFKAGQGIQIETQDREVSTEFVFDDLLTPEILDQKSNQDNWKQNLIPGILNEEIIEFEKHVKAMNAEKKPMLDSLISLIKEAVNEAVPGSECSIYGSFSTELSFHWSDIDLVIKVPYGNPHQCLESIGNVLQSKKWVDDVKHIRNTTVPVLKITCAAKYLSKKVDISIQESRHNGLACVELVREYLETYPPLKYLILILKQFLYHLNLNDTYSGGLSSYGLILMIVFLFQTGEEQAAKSSDLKNVGHLFLAFLKYYGIELDYVNFYYINPKMIKDLDFKWMHINQQINYMEQKIFIQDPLSNNNNVGRSTFKIKEIKNAFTAAYFEAFKQCPCGIHKNLDPNLSKTKKCGSLLLRMFKAYQPQ